MNTRLDDLIKQESMLWGANAAENYHKPAARDMEVHWRSHILPLFIKHKPDLSSTLDFACGYGRNSVKLREFGAKSITLVDVNPDNVAYCRDKFVPKIATRALQNNGRDLRDLGDAEFTHVYSFDSMVHFDLELIVGYVPEFYRVLRPLGTALIHHSNYTGNPGGNFKDNPHWRNFMSKEIFSHLAHRAGFKIVEQNVVGWGGIEKLDCISILRK